MANSKIITLPTISDERGCLTILEREIEFPIKRIFWIYGADGEKRGGHRHKVTKQALIAINGEVSINIRIFSLIKLFHVVMRSISPS